MHPTCNGADDSEGACDGEGAGRPQSPAIITDIIYHLYINAQYTKKFASEDISYLLRRKNIQYLKLYQI